MQISECRVSSQTFTKSTEDFGTFFIFHKIVIEIELFKAVVVRKAAYQNGSANTLSSISKNEFSRWSGGAHGSKP